MERTVMSGKKKSNWQVNLTTAKELAEIRKRKLEEKKRKLEEKRKRSEAERKRKLEEKRKRLETERQRQLEKKWLIQESDKKRQMEKTELSKELKRQERLDERNCQELSKSVSDSLNQLSRIKTEIVNDVDEYLGGFEENQIEMSTSLSPIQALKKQVLEQVDGFLKAQHDSYDSIAMEDSLDQTYELIDELKQDKRQIREYISTATHLV